MPCEAQSPNPDRPQTIREARRAYQKAGRTPSLTAAQTRAAERTIEADRLVKEILEKERRAKENKRKKDEQELRRRAEHRRLVDLGQLPKESLWGNVRASQPRLHKFFGVPPHAQQTPAKDQGKMEVPGSESQTNYSHEVMGVEISDGNLPLLRQLSSPSRATPTTQSACHGSDKGNGEVLSKRLLIEPGSRCKQSRITDTTETQPDLILRSSFSGSQLFSELADDAALEAELNGASTEEINGWDQVAPAGTQESQYDLDGVNDDDLAGLVDTFGPRS